MSFQFYSYELEHIGHQRRQELIQEADQFRLIRALAKPRANMFQQMMTKISSQIAEGVRTMTRQPRRLQGAS